MTSWSPYSAMSLPTTSSGRPKTAAFSPRLDQYGNSVRAQNAIRYIAGQLGVGIFGPNPD